MESKIKVFLSEKNKALNDVLSFINAGHISPISIGSEILKDGNLFMTISYNNASDEKTYELKEVLVGKVTDSEDVLVHEMENSVPEGNVVCHEMIIDNDDVMSIIYLIEK